MSLRKMSDGEAVKVGKLIVDAVESAPASAPPDLVWRVVESRIGKAAKSRDFGFAHCLAWLLIFDADSLRDEVTSRVERFTKGDAASNSYQKLRAFSERLGRLATRIGYAGEIPKYSLKSERAVDLVIDWDAELSEGE